MEILKTRKNKPPKIVIHGDHGVGKSALAAASNNPVFINIEDGLENIDTDAFPVPETFQDVLDQLLFIYEKEHGYKTLVIDSLDWLETLINTHVCHEGGKDSISDFGFGKGFQAALEQFGRVVTALSKIRNERNMAIILLCHSHIKEYQNPLGESYDTFRLKLRDKNAELFLEFVTMVGFLHFETFVRKGEQSGFNQKAKAIGGTERVLSVAPHAAYQAKNRYDITDDIQLPSAEKGWQNIIKAIKGDSK